MEIMRVIITLILSLSTSNMFVSSTNPGVNTRISSESTEILSRKRRFFLARSNGWLVRTTFDAIIPLEDDGGPLLISLSLLYDIDSGKLFPTPADQLGEKRRSDGDRSFKDRDHRSQTLETIEKYLNRMGGNVGNGHACVLRAICEVAETPQTTDGFLGDLISTMLVPSYALDGINGTIFNETDYTRAQKDGYFGDDCTKYHKDCPVSLFQYVEGDAQVPGYYISQFIGSSIDKLTGDYPYFDIDDQLDFI